MSSHQLAVSGVCVASSFGRIRVPGCTLATFETSLPVESSLWPNTGLRRPPCLLSPSCLRLLVRSTPKEQITARRLCGRGLWLQRLAPTTFEAFHYVRTQGSIFSTGPTNSERSTLRSPCFRNGNKKLGAFSAWTDCSQQSSPPGARRA